MANVDARIKTYPATLGLSASGNDIYGEASTGDVDAFDEKIPPLNWDLSRGKYAPFPMLWQHDTKAVCGSWPVVQARPHALYVEGRLAEGFPLASMARKLIQQGHISSLSVGFKEVTPGFTDADGIRVLGRCLLYEVSLTPMAANINAVFETNPNGSLKGITMNTGSTRTTPEVGLDCVRSITLEGVPWAWCPTTRARAGQDKQWLRPLPGIVSVRTTPLWEVIEYRQAESVADLVRLYRPTLGKSSAIILWTYCSDMRVKNAVLCELEIKRQERLVRMKVSSAKRDAQLARLRQQVQDLQRRMAV